MPGVVGSESSAGAAERLAGVAADEQIDGLDSFPHGGLEVAVIGDTGPTGFEDDVGVPIDFGVPDDTADASAFKSEREPFDTGAE